MILCTVSQHESSRVPHIKCNLSLLFVPLQNLMEVCFELGIGIQTLQIDSELSLDYIRFLLMILLSNEAICHVGTITMPCYTYLFLEV